MAYKYKAGQPYMYPRNSLSYTGNFLHMMFSTPLREDYVVAPLSGVRWTAFLFCTPTTNKMPPPPRCGCAARRAPTHLLPSPLGVACLWDPATVAPTGDA